jgi:hypothetical protein
MVAGTQVPATPRLDITRGSCIIDDMTSHENVIRAVPGRVSVQGIEVRVHRNLSNQVAEVWSIVANEGPDAGKVIGYSDSVTLVGCRMFVRRETHRKTLAGETKRGRKRNVLAWTIGKVSDGEVVLPKGVEIDFDFFPVEGRPCGEFYETISKGLVNEADAVRFTAVTGVDGKRHGVSEI